MSDTVSPLAPKTWPQMPPIEGVRIATAEAGIKYKGRTDLLAMIFDEGTSVAGVFTRSKCPSAPVDFCRANLPGGSARILVVNSGNANAFTGKKGRESTALTGKFAAKAVGADESEVFLASTGVIGEPLDATKFAHLLDDMVARAEPGRRQDAALLLSFRAEAGLAPALRPAPRLSCRVASEPKPGGPSQPLQGQPLHGPSQTLQSLSF